MWKPVFSYVFSFCKKGNTEFLLGENISQKNFLLNVLSFCSLNANVPLKNRKVRTTTKHCTLKEYLLLLRFFLYIVRFLYPSYTARKLICWINWKPFVFSKMMTKLSCATAHLLLNVDLFDWQGTTVVIVLFIARYLLRVENIFIGSPPKSGIALLYFFI